MPRAERRASVMCQGDRTATRRSTVDDTAYWPRDGGRVLDMYQASVPVDFEGAQRAINGLKSFVETEEKAAVGVKGKPRRIRCAIVAYERLVEAVTTAVLCQGEGGHGARVGSNEEGGCR